MKKARFRVGFFLGLNKYTMTDKIIDSGSVTLYPGTTEKIQADIGLIPVESQIDTKCDHTTDKCKCEIAAEQPLQNYDVKWEYKPRQNPKWGTVTRDGLIVGRGANKRVVPPDEVWKLAALGATMEEMSDWFQINRETLKYNFSDYIAKGRAELKRRLRAAQIRVAMDGNATMLIWLGKNILQQSDNPVNTDANAPLPWNDSEL